MIKVVNESYDVVIEKLGKDNGGELFRMGIILCLHGKRSAQEHVKNIKHEIRRSQQIKCRWTITCDLDPCEKRKNREGKTVCVKSCVTNEFFKGRGRLLEACEYVTRGSKKGTLIGCKTEDTDEANRKIDEC